MRAPSRGMSDIGARQGADRPRHAGERVFDLSAAKLLRPLVRPGSIRRSSLIERLVRGDSGPVVSVVAPAGYGKTTLLAQWAEANGQAFAWVSVDERDNDPKVLLTYVAEALDAVEPVGGRVFDALASPGSSVPGSVVPRLGNAFSSMTSPVVLVLDDVHLLHNSECRAALSVLADHVPGGSRLVLAGRAEPPVRVARLRAERRILEIGPGDLSLTREEASLLLRAAEVALGEDEVTELHRRTEGWAAGLYLAALYLREGGSPGGAAGAFGGDDRFVSEYVESEFLARISQQQRAFLTRTAVLERMCGPLCEAVLGAARFRRDPDRPGTVGLAAGAAGPAGTVVPLSPPVPRHAAGGTGTPGAGADAGPAAPRRRLVLAQRPAGGSAGVLHRRRGRRHGRLPGGKAICDDLPAGPGHYPAAVVPVAGRPGRDRGTPDGHCVGVDVRRADGAAGGGRAVGRRGRSLAEAGRGLAR